MRRYVHSLKAWHQTRASLIFFMLQSRARARAFSFHFVQVDMTFPPSTPLVACTLQQHPNFLAASKSQLDCALQNCFSISLLPFDADPRYYVRSTASRFITSPCCSRLPRWREEEVEEEVYIFEVEEYFTAAQTVSSSILSCGLIHMSVHESIRCSQLHDFKLSSMKFSSFHRHSRRRRKTANLSRVVPPFSMLLTTGNSSTTFSFKFMASVVRPIEKKSCCASKFLKV